MSNDPLADYFEALDRLQKGRPKVVPVGTKITNDAVSVEAGRKKGSIKKSRDLFRDLIAAIDAASTGQSPPRQDQVDRLNRAKQSAGDLREQLDAALAREICLLAELYETRKRLSQLTGENVLPLRKSKKQSH